METSWILSVAVIVVAICAGLAALGFRGRITSKLQLSFDMFVMRSSI
jgi:hypothetical protein